MLWNVENQRVMLIDFERSTVRQRKRKMEPSHVLTAMGLSPMRARGSVRFSLGIYNTDEDVDYVLKHLPPIIEKLRAISPLNSDHPDHTSYDVDAARIKHEQDLAAALKDSEPVSA